MLNLDTICAIATPPGIGGLSVIRISGNSCFDIADKCFIGKNTLSSAKSHTIHYGKFVHNSILVDTVTAAVFRSPHSFTGEDTVEISCHGGFIVSQEIVSTLIENGSRHAGSGEFTKRAFLNGKLDLTQVEAVADLIHSVSSFGAHVSARQLTGGLSNRLQSFRKSLLDLCSLLELEIDFSEEDIELIDKNLIKSKILEAKNFCEELLHSYQTSEILRNGFNVGIVGYPNSGKSSLLNAFLQRVRAIVSEIPGTTRDFLEEMIYIDGFPVKLIDTAGFRETLDFVEIEGIKMAEALLGQCNLIIVLNDVSISFDNSDSLFSDIQQKFPSTTVILVHNKFDLVPHATIFSSKLAQYISVFNNFGIQELKNYISSLIKAQTVYHNDVLLNSRHFQLLQQIKTTLQNTLDAIEINSSNELIAIDLREALNLIGKISGDIWSEDILNNIFSQFCIGK